MPFRDDAGRWRDILGALNLIEQFVDGMDFETYQADDKTKSAVERQILILSEAAKLLGKRLRISAHAMTGRAFAAWGTFSATPIIEWKIRSSEIR